MPVCGCAKIVTYGDVVCLNYEGMQKQQISFCVKAWEAVLQTTVV